MNFVLKENCKGGESPFRTDLKVEIKDNKLCFYFDCKNSKLYSAGEGFNADLFAGDVCEAFVSIDGNRDRYYEIEVAPNNSIFCMVVEHDGADFKLVWVDNVVESEVIINGNDYKVNFSIPLDKLGYDKGHEILFNAFRIETEGGIRDKNLLAVNPTLCSTFHRQERFIKFEE